MLAEGRDFGCHYLQVAVLFLQSGEPMRLRREFQIFFTRIMVIL